jgi:hypothetical protein
MSNRTILFQAGRQAPDKSDRRERIGQRIGRLAAADMARVNVALAFVMGLGD